MVPSHEKRTCAGPTPGIKPPARAVQSTLNSATATTPAGFELGSGMAINTVLPEDAVAFLTEVAVVDEGKNMSMAA